jgi:hypothetical protein
LKSGAKFSPQSDLLSSKASDMDDIDQLRDRCAELEKLLAQTTILGQQLEFQRNCFIKGAQSAFGLLKLAGSGAGTQEDRTACMFALGKWLEETSSNVVPPIPWVGTEPPVKH